MHDKGIKLSLHWYLEGQGDVISRFIISITHIVNLVILVLATNLLTKSP